MQGALDERRATQIAAKFLQRHDGKLKYLKLIKLIYIVDREALKEHGYALTGDAYFSLPHGPIVSEIQDLITDDPEFVDSDYWKDYIKTSENDVELVETPEFDALSPIANRLVEKVDDEFGGYNRWELRDITHNFPEWEDPGKSRLPITYESILKAVGRDERAEELSSELEARNFAKKILAD